jgi:hypothetical protein
MNVEIIETATFTRQVESTLADDELWFLQLHLMSQPNAGRLIPGSGGLRKLRWGLSGRGKRGGARIIYYWKSSADQPYLLYLYVKNVQPDLTLAELRSLRQQIADEL